MYNSKSWHEHKYIYIYMYSGVSFLKRRLTFLEMLFLLFLFSLPHYHLLLLSFFFSSISFLFFLSSEVEEEAGTIKKKYNVLFSRGYLLWTTLCFRKFYLKISPNTFLWPCFTDDFVFQKPTTNLTNICFQTTYLT